MSLPNICPLCKSKQKFQNVLTTHVYGEQIKQKAFFECSKCQIIYLYPQYSELEQKKIYETEFDEFMNNRCGTDISWKTPQLNLETNLETRKRRMKYLNKYISKSKMQILEVGASSGFMISYLNKNNNKCIAIEPSKINNDYLNHSLKIETFYNDTDMFKKYKRIDFDLIMHFFVLEHIANPFKFVKEQIKMLKKGGKLIFEIPNSDDPLFRIYDLKSFERFYWSKVHNFYFNYKSLVFFLKKFNKKYEIILDQRYDLSNHINWSINGQPGGTGKFTNKLGKKLEETYKKNLINTGYCDTLIGIIHN